METTRFDSRVVQNLRVTGSFDNNGKQTVVRRCWATFKTSENASVDPGGGGSAAVANQRGSFAPMRLYDYETKKAFVPPPNAAIVAVSVLGKTEADHEKLCNFRTQVATLPAEVAGFAIGVMRSPNPDVETVASRDCVSFVTTAFNGTFVQTQVKFGPSRASVAALADVVVATTDPCAPYLMYYQFLSPTANPGFALLNRNIGVCQEHFDRVLAPSTGALRIPWGAPVATTNGKNISDVYAANPGLSLFITPQNLVSAATLGDNKRVKLALLADFTIDVLVELEYDENTDFTADTQVAFSNLDLQSQTL
jgi:hypothetical protein